MRAAAWMPEPFWRAVQLRTRVPIRRSPPVGQVRDGEVVWLGAGGEGIAKSCVDIARGRDMAFVEKRPFHPDTEMKNKPTGSSSTF